MKEKDFQKRLVNKLKKMFPGCVILKNDPDYIQGIPDLLVLYKDRWIALEVKRSRVSTKRPNQEYWVDRLDNMSYASFVYPENEEVILSEIQETFGDF